MIQEAAKTEKKCSPYLECVTDLKVINSISQQNLVGEGNYSILRYTSLNGLLVHIGGTTLLLPFDTSLHVCYCITEANVVLFTQICEFYLLYSLGFSYTKYTANISFYIRVNLHTEVCLQASESCCLQCVKPDKLPAARD